MISDDTTACSIDHPRIGPTAEPTICLDFGNGPDNSLLALGYAGWAPGQLDSEIQANGWLSVQADNDLIFGSDVSRKWERAMAKMGIDFSKLSGDAGHA